MIKETENERCCQNCRFHEPKRRECRCYPPQVWSYDNYRCNETFPLVSNDQWCGEFQPIEKWVLPKGWHIDNMPEGPGGLCEVRTDG